VVRVAIGSKGTTRGRFGHDAAVRDRLDRRGMAVISSAHALADCCQGAVPALLPFLIAEHGWSYATASSLMLAALLASSAVQPLFGHLADRRSMAWLMPAGVLAGTVGVALAAVAPSFWLAFAAVVFAGLGIAAVHPEGSRFANYLSGTRRATGMSVFSLGGNVGFALGPVLVTPAVLWLGLPGALLLILPGALVAAGVAREMPRLATFRPSAVGERRPGAEGRDDWPAFSRLALVITSRTFLFYGMVTFIPLYFVDVLHRSESAGGTALTVYLVGGAVGTMLGGTLADRFGRRPVLIGSLVLCVPLMLAFLAAPAAIATPLLLVAGAATVATFSVTVVMGQEYLPSRIGVASGVTLGLAIGLGGMAAPVLGLIADAHGLETALTIAALLPLIGVAMALTLPRPRQLAPAAA
jgi:FSR family fosmidomycin resistance protein-like MFS transporter